MWDILHIEIPFSPRKEAEFMRRFNIDRAELGEYYKEFSMAIVNNAAMNKAILSHSDRDRLGPSSNTKPFKHISVTRRPVCL